jgi:hypothetical protein
MNMKMNMVVATVIIGLYAGVAQAVNQHASHGDVLLVPYYTVRDGQNTLLSVVNTTSDSKAIKVRFMEAMNSREVLDFNLHLSPFDVWTASVKPTKEGAMLVTNDVSCTVPSIPKGGVEFRPYAYDGRLPEYPLDGGPTDLDRTREGHIELIEMGIAPIKDLGFWDRDFSGYPDSTHIDGVPENCQTFYDNWKEGVWKSKATGALPPTGGLFGSAAIIDVAKGTEVDVPVTILDKFSDVPLHYAPGTIFPNLSEASPWESTVVTGDSEIVTDTWSNGTDAVSAVLMSLSITQEYTVNPNLEADTSWVISFPTKWLHTGSKVAPLRPFSRPFEEGRSCDPISIHMFDREEGLVGNDDPSFSPMPEPERDLLCYETNVLNYNESDIFRSTLVATEISTPFNNGWNRISFEGQAHRMRTPEHLYEGLPVIGFKATRLMNSRVGVGAAYAVSSEHKYNRVISGSSAD